MDLEDIGLIILMFGICLLVHEITHFMNRFGISNEESWVMEIDEPIADVIPIPDFLFTVESKPFDFYFLQDGVKIYGFPPCFSCKACKTTLLQADEDSELVLLNYYCQPQNEDLTGDFEYFLYDALKNQFEVDGLIHNIETNPITIKSPWDCPLYKSRQKPERFFYLNSGFKLLFESEANRHRK